MNIPGFTADAALYRSTKSYKVKKNGFHGGKAIQLAIYTGPKAEPFLPVDGGGGFTIYRCNCPNWGGPWVQIEDPKYFMSLGICQCTYHNNKTGDDVKVFSNIVTE